MKRDASIVSWESYIMPIDFIVVIGLLLLFTNEKQKARRNQLKGKGKGSRKDILGARWATS